MSQLIVEWMLCLLVFFTIVNVVAAAAIAIGGHVSCEE